MPDVLMRTWMPDGHAVVVSHGVRGFVLCAVCGVGAAHNGRRWVHYTPTTTDEPDA